LSLPFAGAFLQLPLWDLLMNASLVSKIVLLLLVVASLMSWTVIFAKWRQFGAATQANRSFLPRLPQGAPPGSHCRRRGAVSRLAADGRVSFGYEEAARQAEAHGRIINKVAVERSLQMASAKSWPAWSAI